MIAALMGTGLCAAAAACGSSDSGSGLDGGANLTGGAFGFDGGAGNTAGSGGTAPAVPAATSVGPEGGIVMLGQARLTIAPNALAETVQISVSRHPGSAAPNLETRSDVYEFSPAGLRFAVPATLAIDFATSGDTSTLRLFRADAPGGKFEPLATSTVMAGQVSAAIDGFSAFVIGRLPDTPYTADFEVAGVGYSAAPVTSGEIDGPGVNIAMATAASIGYMGQSGRIWFAPSSCLAFLVDGKGYLDKLGGPAQSLPYIKPAEAAGRKQAPQFASQLGFFTPLEPSFSRAAALETFRWGVRLDSNGKVYKSLGRYEFYVRFDNTGQGAPTSSKLEWVPGDGPYRFSSGILGLASTTPLAGGYTCLFHHRASITVGDDGFICRERASTFDGQMGTLKECYANGLRNGRYEFKTAAGVVLIGGSFKDGLAEGGWGWFTPTGTRMTGEFKAGERIGTWKFYFSDVLSEEVDIKGFMDSPLGRRERVDGFFKKYHTSDPNKGSLMEEGVYKDGLQHGGWHRYNGNTRTETIEYDADRAIETTTKTCVGTVCEMHKRSRQVRRLSYSWGTCIPGVNFMRESLLDNDERVASSTCYEMSGEKSMPLKGAELTCPGVCAL